MWFNPNTREQCEKIFGHISDWDVTGITDMSGLFRNKIYFNDNINSWDVMYVYVNKIF